MSTATDVAVLRSRISAIDFGPQPRRVLYAGPRDLASLGAVREIFRNVKTLDKDATTRPDIVFDFDRFGIPDLMGFGRWDLIIVPYVLMYVLLPATSLEIMRTLGARVILQENVARMRPDMDPWPDRNRFICPAAPMDVRDRAENEAARGRKRLVNVGPEAEAHYYDNEGGISALWEFV